MVIVAFHEQELFLGSWVVKDKNEFGFLKDNNTVCYCVVMERK
jgi:hypothetical protein